MPVGHDLGIRCDLSVGEAFQRDRIIVAGVGETYSSICFRRDQHQLFVRAALSPDERLVDLDERAERLAIGTHHRGTDFMQPEPSRLVHSQRAQAGWPGTLLEKTRKPFKVWFRAIFEISTHRTGISAKDLQRIMGFGS